LFDFDEGRMGAVVSFLAVLELVKETLIKLSQNEGFGSIYVRRCEAAQE
ncbi:MAG: segregation and condensation protein A, partial [Gammaproteobacteria bacterium]